MTAAAKRVDSAVREAEQTVAAQPLYWLQARLNRAGCDCPPWEVEAWGEWRRAALTWSDGVEAVLPDDENLPDGSRLWVQVEEAESDLVREDGRHFLRFRVVARRAVDAVR